MDDYKDIDDLEIQQSVDAFNATQPKDVMSKDTSVPHELKKALFEDYFVPAHEPRTNSALYNRTHDELINAKDTPCYVCGVSKSTIKDLSRNTVGATQLETHHFHCEWSLVNQVDWDVMKALHPDFPAWDKIDPNDTKTFFNFVDHEYNMMVLCDVHHRAKLHGIHALEYAVWIGQKFLKKGFKYIPDVGSKGMDGHQFVDDMS